MSRTVRVALVVLAVFGLLVAAAVVALPRLVDVNQYRPLIVEKVRELTGRTVELGDISLRILPMPALHVEQIAVSEGPRYPGSAAMKTDSLAVRVELLPLLRGRVAIRSVVLDKPSINLIRDAQGRWNFDDLIARAGVAAGSGEGGGGSMTIDVERAIIRSAHIHLYDDSVTKGERIKATIGPIDAILKGWGADRDTEIDISMQMGVNRLEVSAILLDAGSHPRLSARVSGKALKADELGTLLPWLGIAHSEGLELGGEIDLDGSAEVPLDRPETLQFHGTIRLHDLSYRDASMTRPLENVSGILEVEGDRAEWKEFSARIGDSTLQGRMQVEDFLKPRIGFDLSSSRLDLDEILAVFSGAPSVPGGDPENEGVETGTGLFEQVRATGRLDVGAIRFQTFELSNVRASGGLREGVIALSDLQADFYSGRLSGSASVDLGSATTRYTVGVKLEKVDLDPVLTAYDKGLAGLLRGSLGGRLDIEASGLTMAEILDSARGTGSLEVSDGAVASFSVLKFVAASLESAGGRGIGLDETPFEFLRGTLAIGNSKARTDDLVLHSADLDLAGAGWVGLDASLDLDIKARFSQHATAGMVQKNQRVEALVDSDGRVVLHFNLSGPLADPKFRIATGAQLRQKRNILKEKVKQRAIDRLRNMLQKRPEDDQQQEGEAEPRR
ncbi:MAG: AsmA family protein [Acidobacteria bacterium]|nr:AsmA family protein [Acidobacteriota bacterium]